MEKQSHWALHKVMLTAAWRRKGVNILLAAVVLIGVFTSMILHNLTERQESALEDLKKNTDIHCIITDPQGIDSSNLKMLSSFVDRLTGLRHDSGCYLDEYVKNICAAASSPLEKPANYSLSRIYSLDSDRLLSEVEGAAVYFYDGWDEAILQTREQVCLVPEGTQTDVLSDGKEYISIETQNGRSVELLVIGTVTGGPGNTIHCPFYMEIQVGVSQAFLVDTCSFDIMDNNRLDEAKDELFKEFVEPKLSNQSDGVHFGVIIQDETYLNTLKESESNLSMLRLLLPILMILSCCIGFFASYLTIRGRVKEFAVMRCLGMSQAKIFGLVFEELLVLTILGGAGGLISGFILEGAIKEKATVNAALITGIFVLGAAIAALRVTSVSVMKLMKVED